jgi:hypothetical protein
MRREDQYHGKGGSYVVKNGQRVRVHSTGLGKVSPEKKVMENGAKVQKESPPRKN